MSRLAILILSLSLSALAQSTPDPSLLAEIQKIPAIDNHTHVMRVTAPGERDDEFDALPCETLEPADTPYFLRQTNPDIVAAWQQLYGYRHRDQQPEHVKELVASRRQVLEREGDRFPTWVLDRLNIQIMFANRIRMGRGIAPPRFVWVPYDDALVYPLNNAAMADTPDRKFFYGREEMLLRRYLADLGLSALPKTLPEYVQQVVVPTLQRQKQNGAVAIKFESTYLRALDFAPVADDQAAARVFQEYAGGGVPDRSRYKQLQDYLFRAVAIEAGRLGLPLHIHTGVGCGRYFQIAGSNPLLLEPLLNDPRLAQTKFVLIHGAWPFTEQMASMLTRPNVFTDTSAQPLLLPRPRVAQSLREWLELVPEKVLFGTDLYSADEGAYAWDVVGSQANTNAREALALALTGMMQDGEISRAQALELARLVLRGNAEKLYGLK